MVTTSSNLLPDEMLARFEERAPRYDRENRFFQEDFDELKASGYLTAAIPADLGGGGLNYAEMMQLQRKLAYHAAPTALAINMHVYWAGCFADMWRAGDKTVEPFLREMIAGEVYGAGHAEGGNDLPVLLSTTRAERVDGGYKFYGRKSFGSLGLAWTRLGMHGMDASDPNAPKIVHAFMTRGSEGSSTVEVWDTVGMRATQSDDTVLDGVFVPDEMILRVIPAGAAGMDFYILALFAWALGGFANVYYGQAQRAFDTVVASIEKRTSIGLSRPLKYHAEVQHELADMWIDLDSIGPCLDGIANDWVSGVDHGAMWGAKLIAAKYRAVNSAWNVVDKGLDLMGGFGIFKDSGYERLWRDARLGRIHPGNSALSHEFVAKTVLGINPDETPRWG
jgi:alkylation response protein AidB-like acyl-CoA dehydrogenase